MIVHIARREALEQLRNPMMLGICAVLYALVGGVVLCALLLLDAIEGAERLAALASITGAAPEVFLDSAVTGCLMAFNFLLYSQYLGFVGVIAGHSLLHDRQLGTLPFLLLAPVSRGRLLLGKSVGAWALVTLLTVVFGAGMGIGLALLDVTAGHDALTARSLGWWLALGISGPAWGVFVAMAAAVTSSLARDVRLAQQAVWFIVFFVQLIVAFLVTGSLASPLAQALAGGLALGSTAGVWYTGTLLMDEVER